MPPEDPSPSPTFITALSDAYLVPRDDRYAIFWRTAGRDLCGVAPEVAEAALRGAGPIVRLGSWSGTIRGRHDEWSLWWSAGVPWAATSDVDDGDQTLLLIERWRAEVARAHARGESWDAGPPADAQVPQRPAASGGVVRGWLGGLRSFLLRG